MSSLFHADIFRKYNFIVSQLKHLTPKTSSLGIFKLESTIFSPLKLTEILGNLSRFQIVKNKQNFSNVQSKTIFKSSLNSHVYWDPL